LAAYDPGHAREIWAWMQSGGLHEPLRKDNEELFKEAERLMLLKYYVSPDGASEPQKPSFVVGGPQVIISADRVFINRALQAQQGSEGLLGDLATLEFAACIEASDEYNNRLTQEKRSRNILFDTHSTTVQDWRRMFKRPELGGIVSDVMRRRQKNVEFGQQLGYYAKTFQKVFGR